MLRLLGTLVRSGAASRAEGSALRVVLWPALLLLFATIPGTAFSAQFLIKPDGTGLYPTIQAAIDGASEGDILVLTDGMFTGAGNRDLDFRGKTLTLRSQSGVEDMCVLDPGVSGSVPHRIFQFTSGESPELLIEQVTLRGGVASGSTGLAGSGGAVLCTNGSSPTFRDCVFQGNSAASDGGAVSARQSSPSFFDCRFEENVSSFGGAVFADQPCLTVASSSGPEPPPIFIERCEFLSNQAGEGGAIYGRGIHTHLFIRECEFRYNFADHGGAMKLHGPTARISDCRVEENWGGSEGGGFAFESTIFCGFSAPSEAGGDPVDVLLERTLISRNFAGTGGAALLRGYSVSFVGCTIAQNIAPEASGIYARSEYDTDPFLPSSVSLDNVVLAFGVGGGAIVQDAASQVVAHCSDLYGNDGGDWTGEIADQLGVDGNLSEDPSFCDREADDYNLRGDSPCQGNPEGCELIGAFPVDCSPATIPGLGESDPTVAKRVPGLRSLLNPARGRVDLELTLPTAGRVVLSLHNPSGRRLAAWDLGILGDGAHQVSWAPEADGPVGSGVHFVRMETDGGPAMCKVLWLR